MESIKRLVQSEFAKFEKIVNKDYAKRRRSTIDRIVNLSVAKFQIEILKCTVQLAFIELIRYTMKNIRNFKLYQNAIFILSQIST